MSRRDYRLYLIDIKDCCGKIIDYTRGVDYEEFLHNPMRIDAVVRNLITIGEAAKKLPPNLRNKNPQVDWKSIAGLRDVAIHDYFGLDYAILWNVIQSEVPKLRKDIEEIIAHQG